MLLACTCGRMYRVPDGAPPIRRDCPVCGAILRDAVTGVAQEDLGVLKQKERALRDGIRQRDRDLRRAQLQIAALKSEVDTLRAGQPDSAAAQRELEALRARVRALEEERVTGKRPPSDILPVLAAPVRIERATEWKPLALPSDRLDLTLGSGIDEQMDGNVMQLPSDRLPLLEEIPELPCEPAPVAEPPPPVMREPVTPPPPPYREPISPPPGGETVTAGASGRARGFLSRIFKRRG